MTVTDIGTQSPERRLLSTPDSSRAWWFLGTLAVLRNPIGAPRTPAVIELTVPPGGSPPSHLHEELDDSFLLLDGEVVVRCGEDTVVARPGSYVMLPHGVEHTFRVTSRAPARMLLVHADDSFLRFIEEIGTPTAERRLPPPEAPDADLDKVVRVSAEHGAPIVGPSLEEAEARPYVTEGDPEPALGPVHHVALEVTDLPKSERWYIEALGLTRMDGEVNEDGTGHVALVSATGGWVLTLASASSPRVEHVALSCADRGALVDRQRALTERGLAPGSITDAPYGSGFVMKDPDGFDVELFAPPPPQS
jgi:mannose-6-phosphate isomerase-like protein (cupin superfamily)/catechol 2,3-dioxygenase-like lactoylglutathione lyase family enzyme